MKKCLLLIFLFPFFHAGYAQLTTTVSWTTNSSLSAAQVINYSQARKLAWKDFRGTIPNGTGRVAAMTAAGFGYSASALSRGSMGELKISIYCYFDKNKSWYKRDLASDYILLHEQHHFDVSFLAANMFIEKVKATTFTVKNYNEVLTRLYTECCNVMNTMQDDYDGQTKNGLVKDEQERWNATIDEKLAAIKD